jgi:ankyrin repeat protein
MKTLEQLRRDATALKKAHAAGDGIALTRVRAHVPGRGEQPLKHADFLHVIAREQGFASWPHLKTAAETEGMDRAQRQQRLVLALVHGQDAVIRHLLETDPSLPEGHLGLSVMLYDHAGVARLIAEDPRRAVQPCPQVPPLTRMAQSRALHLFPEREGAMLAIADLLLRHGADPDHAVPEAEGLALSTLYFAMGHGNNMALSEWLLDHGADPNDGESLYHATELGHHGGLRLLLANGARPQGTNALLRAMDFHDVEAVRMLLAAGAEPDDFNPAEVGGEAPFTIPALHQAARRMSPPEMIALLLDHGADPRRLFEGVTPYAYARIYGNAALAAQLQAAGHATELSEDEALLARVAEGEVPEGRYVDPARLPTAARNIIREIVHLPEKVGHVQRLAAVGVEYDRPDAMGVTPVQGAGWAGLPEMMQALLRLKPDLAHVNDYGGTLFSTILHGAENNPDRAGRDYIGCLRMALEEGVALPRVAAERVGDPEIAAFLRDWAKAVPGQVVDMAPA